MNMKSKFGGKIPSKRVAEGGASPASAGCCEHAGETRGQDPRHGINVNAKIIFSPQ
jgi:hypothetical protein